MKANEIRVNNIVNCNGIQVNVSPELMCLFLTKEITFNPITLSEDWLIRAGFEKEFYEWKHKSGFIIDLFSNAPGFWIISSCEKNTKIEFVHQLQNLHFLLLGEELVFSQI